MCLNKIKKLQKRGGQRPIWAVEPLDGYTHSLNVTEAVIIRPTAQREVLLPDLWNAL
jgi:hypothetical protein